MPTTLKHIKELVNQIEHRTKSIVKCEEFGNYRKSAQHLERRQVLKAELFQRVEGLLIVKELYEEVKNENESEL